MPQVTLSFVCWHEDCAGQPPTEVKVNVPAGATRASARQKELVVYCTRQHPNIVTIPEGWGQRLPTLGGDDARPLHGRRP